MARQRPKLLEPSNIGPPKFAFDGDEGGWVFVKKQRVIIVLPSLPLPEPFTVEKPANSQSQAELRDIVTDTQENTPLHTVVPSLPLPDHFILQKPATSHSQAELRDLAADMHETTPLHTLVPSLPPPEHFVLYKPATSQLQAELRDGIADTLKTAPGHTMVTYFPLPEHHTLQKPETCESQAELKADKYEATLVHTVVHSLPVTEHVTLQKPATSQSLAELRVEARKATPVQAGVPSLPVLEYCTLQKPATSRSQAKRRDFVADAHETSDFVAVDKPEIVMGHDHTTRKAPGPRRSLQDRGKDPDRRLAIHRSRTGHKSIRFPKVMCSSVVMDNEKLRVVNLEKKVEKAGGLNEWVGSIGLGREFERMLRGQRMSKFQMANLTMEKLKHMGALAVGPRRKLIHAIRCVYHPHCLRASLN